MDDHRNDLLALSYLTGFFGQNFSLLVGHITGRVPFYVFGLGLEVIAALILLYFSVNAAGSVDRLRRNSNRPLTEGPTQTSSRPVQNAEFATTC